jgi:tRNA threonylcarbamoyladenosine biosynthesis protein TsaB
MPVFISVQELSAKAEMQPAIMRSMSSQATAPAKFVPNLVAFETSSETLSVSVVVGENTFSEDIANAGAQNSELALPTMHALLKRAGVSLQQIDLVAFGQGPGSFTGVRIACGIAQGLAYGLGRRVIALPTTLVLAEQARVGAALAEAEVTRIAVAIDARMGEVYFAAYEVDSSLPSGFKEIVPPMLAKPDALPALLGECVCIGSAFAVKELANAIQRSALRVKQVIEPAMPQSFFLATLARRLYAAHGDAATVAPQDAAPLYLRNNVAMTIDERKALHEAKKVAA